MNLVSVGEAESVVLSTARQYGVETVDTEKAGSRVIARAIVADRDMPAGNLATMDGIAIDYKDFKRGIRKYRVAIRQAAGKAPKAVASAGECVEIATGAELAKGLNTVIPYEHLRIDDDMAHVISDGAQQWQNVRRKGADKHLGDTVVPAGSRMGPAELAVASTVGATSLAVRKLPRLIIVTTGDEHIAAGKSPKSFQIRGSNNYFIRAALQERFGIWPDLTHLPDDPDSMFRGLADCFETYDVVIICGGVSRGRFDYVPKVLESLSARTLFHGVSQKPGKPFWFGTQGRGRKQTVIFALPGNPVSAAVCLYRYATPWLMTCLGLVPQPIHARLCQNLAFELPLQYFPAVSLRFGADGCLKADPIKSNSSGDLTSLVQADGFIELPAAIKLHKKGTMYRVWSFRDIPVL